MMKSHFKQSENEIQRSIVNYFKSQYKKYCIFAVPNGGSRNVIEATKMKATGTLAGVSDLIVLLPNKCLFIEVKTDKGTQSDRQKEFENEVKSLGFDYYIVRNLNDFILIINTQLTTK